MHDSLQDASQIADVIIVGAGISGLSLGFRLRQLRPEWRIVILEAAPRPGGTIWTEYEQEFIVEHGPNGFLASKPSTLRLVHDLGLEADLAAAEKASKYRYVYDGRHLYRLPTGPWSLITFPLLPWRSKWAILTERWRRRKIPETEESVYDFIARRTDDATAQLFAELLVTGIFAGDAKQLSMAACFPRIIGMERAAGSITAGFLQEAKRRKQQARQLGAPIVRGSQLHSLRLGLRQLIETLASFLSSDLRLNTPVRHIRPLITEKTALWQVVSNGHRYSARQLVLACPAYIQAELLGDVDPHLAELIAAIPYVPIAVIALGYRKAAMSRPLEGFGYLTTADSRSPFLGAQWCSNIFPGRAPADCVLIRFMAGGIRFPKILDYRDDEIVQLAHQETAQLFGAREAPIYTRVIRWTRAIPQYVLGHLDRLGRIKSLLERYPGLYLAGNAYHGVSLNDCTEQAELLASRIVNAARTH